MKMTMFTMMVAGVCLAFSSSSWITAWMGLEINLISFIPLMMTPTNKLPNEAALKYFLTQSLASSLLLFAVLISPLPKTELDPTQTILISSIVVISLLMKLGAAPFHFWFPPTMEGLSWGNCMILATLQKIAPIILLGAIFSPMLLYVALLSAVVGALGGFNQLSLRKIIAYSSIGHLGWIISTTQIAPTLMMFYLSTYMYLTSAIMLMFIFLNIHHLTQIPLLTAAAPASGLVLMNLLSLGGLPPFLGFLPKWAVIQQLSTTQALMPLAILIISSLTTLFYYMRITYSSFSKFSWYPPYTPRSPIMLPLMLSAPSLMALPLMIAPAIA